ncbi:protein transport protein S31 [Geranomyces variabilis]|nr:protein transport protein S31 [Geranomyces variabilis]
MRLRHINRTATIAWFPGQADSHGPLLAGGTVAGALDASFSTSAELEIFDLNLNSKPGSPGANKLRKLGGVSCTARFNRLAWTKIPGDKTRPLGMIASGMDNGEVVLWNPAGVLESNIQKAVISRNPGHSGPVRALGFSPLAPNLLCTGSSQGEIFIWDTSVSGPLKPGTPGAKSARLEDITAIAWNNTATHILATASNNGNIAVWDLKSRREICMLIHPGGRKPITAIAWDPVVPTQLIAASEDDNAPALLVWNLQNAAAPQAALHGHQKGVLSMAWCAKDSDLLLSCGKDNSTLAWNPNTGELIGELAHTGNWAFDVQWCPRNPDLVAVSSYDGNLSVHSLQASQGDEQEVPPTPVVHAVDNDPFSAAALNQVQAYVPTAFALRQPPKWLRRPVGAIFGFGGKLVSFDALSRRVVTRTVPTDAAFAHRVDELEAVMTDGQIETYKQFCERRAAANDEGDAVNDMDREMWKFMKVMLENGARERVVEYLGLDNYLGNARLAGLLEKLKLAAQPKPEESEASAQPTMPSAPPAANGAFSEAQFSASQGTFPELPPLEEPVPQPFVPQRKLDPFAIFPEKTGTESDIDVLITKAVILGDFETAVDVALGANRLADAMMLAVSGGSELLLRTQQEYFRRQKKEKTYIRVLQSVVGGDLTDVVENGQLEGREGGWKDILALICTYGRAEDSSDLFISLGKRLEEASAKAEPPKTGAPRENKKFAAVLCYLAAGDLKKVVDIWGKKEVEEEQKLLQGAGAPNKGSVTAHASHMVALQSLIEKVTVFRKAIGFADPELSSPSGFFQLESLYDHYAEYACSIASQGKLDMAWTMLELVPEGFRWSTKQEGHGPPPGTEDAIAVLRNRVFQSGGLRRQVAPPVFPYELQDVVGAHAHQAAQPAYTSQAGGAYVNTAYPPYQQPAATASYDQWGQQTAYAAAQPAYATAQPAYSAQPAYPAQGYQPAAQSAYDQMQQPGATYPSTYGNNARSNSFVAPPPMGGPPADSASSFQSTQNTAPPTHFNDPPFVPSARLAAAKPAAVAAPLAPMSQMGVPPPSAQSWQTPGAARAPTPMVAPPPMGAMAPAPAYTPSGAATPAAQRAALPASRILSPPPAAAGGSFGGGDNYANSFGQQPAVGGGGAYPQGGAAGQQFQGQQQLPPQQPAAPHVVTRSTSLQGAPPPGSTQGPQRPASTAPPASKYPPGDRSHIPAAHKPLFVGLQKYLTILKNQSSAPQQKRIFDDAEKKMNIFFDQLNAEEVPADIVAQMQELVKAMDAHDYLAATNIQVDLMTTRFDATGKWMQAVKRLIVAAETAAGGGGGMGVGGAPSHPQTPVPQHHAPHPQQPQQPFHQGHPQQHHGAPPPSGPPQHQQGPPPPAHGMPPQGGYPVQYQQQHQPPPPQQQRMGPPPPQQHQQHQQQHQPPPPMGGAYYGR